MQMSSLKFLHKTFAVTLGRSSDPRNFVCSSTECTWDPPADTPNCCIEYMVVMTNASGTVQVSVGLATVYNRPDVTSDTAKFSVKWT